MQTVKKIIKKIDSFIDKLLFILFLLCLCIGLYVGYDSYLVYTSARLPNIEQFKPVSDNGQINTEILLELSDEAIGWISVDNTLIDYPLMQGLNNTKYVNTDPYGYFSTAGSIFLDSNNASNLSDPINLVYGHHMERGLMFGALDDFRKLEFCQNHTTAAITSVLGESIPLELFAVASVLTSDSCIFDVLLANAQPELALGFIQEKSNYLAESSLSWGPRVFILSTCTSANSQDRLIVVFREKP